MKQILTIVVVFTVALFSCAKLENVTVTGPFSVSRSLAMNDSMKLSYGKIFKFVINRYNVMDSSITFQIMNDTTFREYHTYTDWMGVHVDSATYRVYYNYSTCQLPNPKDYGTTIGSLSSVFNPLPNGTAANGMALHDYMLTDSLIFTRGIPCALTVTKGYLKNARTDSAVKKITVY